MTIEFVAQAKLPTRWGDFRIYGFKDLQADKEHVALALGKLNLDEPLLCRIHSECLTGDSMFSLRCDCGPQLEFAMQQISEAGRGLILYLRQEGRGIGLLNKLKAYALQDAGADTVEANEQLGFEPDSREYQICKPMLDFFDIRKVKLLTNNPAKVKALQDMGIEVNEIIPIHTGANPHNETYLAVKINKLGHMSKSRG
ncbi:MAG: GTP cyclohydrolase II [Gammaproteobacteria bacterium]|nr:GTP cyclohydrolase II [Gammaproteobacteria bacterium]MDE0479774.1 GTP cyclohydrolase II [Gammaproteobacteria bacterium]MDE0509480.1 GTP cyclohydrolase II [Gammaproteobacteria bacterium]MXX06300.1 GTP cyclohydrolase II [Gammaproteobacteria bacterium]MXY91611.1 GTP cyclohydrolase II [Gammaproteobacteria bacterium]